MIKKTILFLLVCSFMGACRNEDSLETDREAKENTDALTSEVIFTRSGDSDDVSILVYKKNSAQYLYTKTLSPAWQQTATGSTSTTYEAIENLELGDYRFLFYKHTPKSVSLTGAGGNGDKYEDITFTASPDGDGYVKPVDELFLPNDIATASQNYTFTGTSNKRVECTLTRAVAQIEVNLRRGYQKDNSSEWIHIPYENPALNNILKTFEENSFSLEIENVGSAINMGNLLVGKGVGSVKLKPITPDFVIDKDGFAKYDGPFVFPNEYGTYGKFTFKYKKVTDSTLQSIPVKCDVQANKKTVINLWLVGKANLTVTVSIEEMTETPGTSGMWGGEVNR